VSLTTFIMLQVNLDMTAFCVQWSSRF